MGTQSFVEREHGMEAMTNKLDGRLVSCQDPPSRAVIFGQTEEMRRIHLIVEKVAGTSAPVLILGEKGAGKEVLARFIHCRHPGPDAPFFKVSPPIPKGNTLDEVALRVEEEVLREEGGFGLDLGQKTLRRLSTLFVEEVADLNLNLQAQLFQLIQGSRSFVLGGAKDIPITLRVICASSHDLEHEVAVGRLREDLLSSLSVVKLSLPPLRERKEDIPQLAHYFWEVYNRKFGCQADPPTLHLIDRLQKHVWPGNIRELENALKRYVVLGTDEIISSERPAEQEPTLTLEPSPHRPISLKQLTREAAHELESKIILKTLQKTQWNRKQAARALNISYRALLYKIKEAGLPPKKRRKATNVGGNGEGPYKNNGSKQDAA
jgi:two-component system, NtrC family, response regulator AtoC